MSLTLSHNSSYNSNHSNSSVIKNNDEDYNFNEIQYDDYPYSFSFKDTNSFMSKSIIFNNIHDCIENIDDSQKFQEIEKENIKLKYDIVMKDIIIYSLNKKMKTYEYHIEMWTSFQNTFLK